PRRGRGGPPPRAARRAPRGATGKARALRFRCDRARGGGRAGRHPVRRELARPLLHRPPMRTIDPLLHETVARGASDLHVTADSPPFLRIHGELLALAHPPPSRAEARALCYGALTEDQRRRFEHERELDFAMAVPGLGRFRGNLYFTRGTVGGAFRVIPADLPVLDSLRLPP